MSNTSLRFLLLGEDHLQNLHFERALNELRYYRVAPAMRMQDASVMASCVENGFDVMIFSGALLNAVGNVTQPNDLDAIPLQLKMRPRKRFGFKCPIEVVGEVMF